MSVIDPVIQAAFSAANSKYEEWLIRYVIGDRIKSDMLLKCHKQEILQEVSKYTLQVPTTLYRGILIDPKNDPTHHNLWLYPEVSFTTDITVAKAFADNDSVYGIVFPKEYKGYLLELHYKPENYFTWFDYRWDLPDHLRAFIDFWNQKEVILGQL